MSVKTFKIAFFDTKSYMKEAFKQNALNLPNLNLEYDWIGVRLNEKTVKFAEGCDGVCIFVNDRVDRPVVERLAQMNIKLVALRCAGYNNCDLAALDEYGITVVRVPAYSPHAVAEHAIAMVMTLNRKIHHAYQRVRDQNFSLDRLVGFDMFGKTMGVVGTGKIGQCLIDIALGFGMKVLCFDVKKNPEIETKQNCKYVSLDEVYANSDVISFHVPLLKSTHHMVNAKSIKQMKKGVYLVNTSRGELFDTAAVIQGLKNQHIAGLCADVYEHEGGRFYEDFSELFIDDDELIHLINLPNVIVTSHQAFLTKEALDAIAKTTAKNIHSFAIDEKRMKQCNNSVNEVDKLPKDKKQVKPNLTAAANPGRINQTHRHYSTISSNDKMQKLRDAMVPIPRNALSIASSL